MNEEKRHAMNPGGNAAGRRTLGDLLNAGHADERPSLLTRSDAEDLIRESERTVLHRLDLRHGWIRRNLLSSPIRIGVTLMTTSAFASLMAIAVSHLTSTPPEPVQKTPAAPPVVLEQSVARQHSETVIAPATTTHIAVVRSEARVNDPQLPIDFSAKASGSDTLNAVELDPDQLARLGVELKEDGSIVFYEIGNKGDKVHSTEWQPDGGLSNHLMIDPKTLLVKPTQSIPHAVTYPDGYARMFSGEKDKGGFSNMWFGPPRSPSFSSVHIVSRTSVNGRDSIQESYKQDVNTRSNFPTYFHGGPTPEIPPPPPPPPGAIVGAAVATADLVSIDGDATIVSNGVLHVSPDGLVNSGNISRRSANSGVSSGPVQGKSVSIGVFRSKDSTTNSDPVKDPTILIVKDAIGSTDSVGVFRITLGDSLSSDSHSAFKMLDNDSVRVFELKTVEIDTVVGPSSNHLPSSDGPQRGVSRHTIHVRTFADSTGEGTSVLRSILSTPDSIGSVRGVSIPHGMPDVHAFEHQYRQSTGDTTSFNSLIPVRVTNYKTPQHFTLIFWYERTPEVLNIVPRSAVEKADARPKNIELSVYPNPTSGETNVHYVVKNGEPVTINVVSLLGHKLIEGGVRQDQHGDLSLDLSSLEPGVYLLIATLQNGEKAVERVVVTK